MLKSDLIWGCVKYCFQFVRPGKKNPENRKKSITKFIQFPCLIFDISVIQFEISASQKMIDIPVEKASYLNQELF